MVGRWFELGIDRNHPKSRLPANAPALPGDPFPDEEERDGMFPCLGFRDRDCADGESVSFRKVAEVSLMFLDKKVVAAPQGSDQRYRESAGNRESDSLFPSLRDLVRAETFCLGER